MDAKKNKINVAFIGGGINSAVGSAHYAAINLDNNFNLAAACFSRDRTINEKTAEAFKVPKNRLYRDMESLLGQEKENLDAVILLTPSNEHMAHLMKIFKYDIPVICEKSLVSSVEETLVLKQDIEEKNNFLVVIYNYLGYPMVRELRHVISSGELGEIKHIQVEMPQESFAKKQSNLEPVIPQAWRLKDEFVPTVSLDLGVHLHILIKYLINQTPISVTAKTSSHGNFSVIADDVSCLIEYTNNVTCNMWYSKIALGTRNGMKIRIYGSNGSAEWIQEYPEIIQRSDATGNRWTIDRGNGQVSISNLPRYTRFKAGHPTGFIEAFANYYQDIANALEIYSATGKVKLIECYGIDESLEGIKLFEAIQRSSTSRMWENI